MVADIAHRWADALESTPDFQRGNHYLRDRGAGGTVRLSPLGVLADLVMPSIPTLTWMHAHNLDYLVPLVGTPQTTCLTDCVVKHCRLRLSDPAFSSGSLPISTLAAKHLSWEHLAKLIRSHASEL
ncbi:MAG: hypothetical protein ACO395_07460 [Pontimonas sp.]